VLLEAGAGVEVGGEGRTGVLGPGGLVEPGLLVPGEDPALLAAAARTAAGLRGMATPESPVVAWRP